ncbi:MAG: cytochrome c [Pseudobdellovibrionaceae bacterium]
MKKQIIKKILLGTILLGFVSCISHQMKDMTTADVTGRKELRKPASDYALSAEVMNFLRTDPFSKDGYDHNVDGTYQNRIFQFGSELSAADQIRELAGREIWFKSSPNERFHTYFFPQKMNVPIAWNKILHARGHDARFQIWGLINDPDCCVPGQECRSRGMKYNGRDVTLEDTFGWEYCSGDEALLNAVRNPNQAWQDPACQHPIIKEADLLDDKPRENRCELAFGNPTGAVGYRKFPNPRFNPKTWQKVGGWEGFERNFTEAEIDSSIEPPFRVAKSCASCHAGFDPLHPPSNLSHPTWKNIKGETGNQYINVSAILGSGAKQDSLEYQMFVHSRPGAVDTSAIPNDFVNNPGTVNAVINFSQRPKFEERVTRWVNEASCSGPETECQVIPYPNGQKKYWKKVVNQPMQVMHILKGGEDNVGADLAVQRVYLNIGMCAEQCWVNHLANIRELDESRRGFGQTPFDIQQCRRDCASWRANEDRVGDILSYLLSRRPTDLKDAVASSAPKESRDQELVKFINTRYNVSENTDLIGRGRDVFARNCAQCHSSQNDNKNDLSTTENFLGKDFLAMKTLDNGEILREDWLGNDKSTSANIAGTFMCRALHSNHSEDRVWEEFSSDTYKRREHIYTDARGNQIKGGRGYYRNISLLNVWAHAPFGHANAIGPEICGNVPDRKNNFWRTTVETVTTGPADQFNQVNPATKYTCEAGFDPSIEGRLKLYEESMDEILTPSVQRRKKVARMDEGVRFPLGISLHIGNYSTPMYLEFQKGIVLNSFGSLDIKGLAKDLLGAMPKYIAWVNSSVNGKAQARSAYDEYWKARVPNAAAAVELAQTSFETFEVFKQMATPQIQQNLQQFMRSIQLGQNQRLQTYFKYYSNCDSYYENLGHNFGTQLSQDDKTALKAFLATM